MPKTPPRRQGGLHSLPSPPGSGRRSAPYPVEVSTTSAGNSSKSSDSRLPRTVGISNATDGTNEGAENTVGHKGHALSDDAESSIKKRKLTNEEKRAQRRAKAEQVERRRLRTERREKRRLRKEKKEREREKAGLAEEQKPSSTSPTIAASKKPALTIPTAASGSTIAKKTASKITTASGSTIAKKPASSTTAAGSTLAKKTASNTRLG
ncbi:hypothetical protein BDZ88DRAFT_436868 [Geranomyces variabilis]|nr:hypothetical protein BDZ88DRAFT_436868 [Geranomyces variabilis]KAJ3142084.1 hypothetical protein HDU90_004357 [Geranomyces variabilis]